MVLATFNPPSTWTELHALARSVCAKIQRMQKRIVFMGSPDFAVPCLERLCQNYSIVGVVPNPTGLPGAGALNSPAGEGSGAKAGLPIIQPLKVRQPEAMQTFVHWAPDVSWWLRYLVKLRQDILGLPPSGCINVHASLLPRWQAGARPSAAILHGDAQTGVTIMANGYRGDTGAMLNQRALDILAEERLPISRPRLADCDTVYWPSPCRTSWKAKSSL